MRPIIKCAGVGKGRRTGFSLLELLVAIVVVSLLAGMFIKNSAQFYQEQAEKVAMEQTLGVIRSALHLKMASLIAKNRTAEIPLLAERNPMEWLAEKPKNYMGEYYAPEPEDVVSGHWYFDLRKRYLIYSVQNAAHFRLVSGDLKQIHFQVKLVKNSDVSLKKNKDLEGSEIEGVVLEPVVPYTWF